MLVLVLALIITVVEEGLESALVRSREVTVVTKLPAGLHWVLSLQGKHGLGGFPGLPSQESQAGLVQPGLQQDLPQYDGLAPHVLGPSAQQ